MENCLLTQLNGVVNSPDMEYFDALQFKIKFSTYGPVGTKLTLYNPSGSTKFLFGGDGVRVKILSNGHVVNGSDEFIGDDVVITSETRFARFIKAVDESEFTEFLLIGLSKITKLWTSYTGDFVIKDPHKLKYVQKGACNSSDSTQAIIFYPYPGIKDWDLSYLNDIITDVSAVTEYRRLGNNVSGGEEYIENYHSLPSQWATWTSMTSISAYGTYFRGDIAPIGNLVNVKSLAIRLGDEYGDIASLGKLTSLNSLNIYGSNVTGAIGELVSELVSNGKTTGSIGTFITNGKVTFGDTPLGTHANGYTIAWTSASDITVTAK